MGSTSCPGGPGPGTEGARCRPDVPGDPGPGLRPTGSTSSPGRFGPGSKGLRGRPAVPGHTRLGLKAGGVDQFSRATRDWVRVPAVSTSYPGRHRPFPKDPRVDQLSLAPGPESKGPRIDQLSGVIWARVQWLLVFISCPGRFWPGFEVPRCRSALPADSDLGPSARGIDHLSRAIRARVRRPAWSTCCPGRLSIGSVAPRGKPALPGNWGQGPSACGVDQMSRRHVILTSSPLLPGPQSKHHSSTSCPG